MSSNAERFGGIVRARRLDLDLNQLEVAASGGPSNTTQTEIENGRIESLSRNLARKLDEGLQWEPGSARRTWEGGDPSPIPRVPPTRDARLAEVERSNLSESTKQWLIRNMPADVPALSILPDATEDGDGA